MSDGISEWNKMRWEKELKEMSGPERKKAMSPRQPVPELLPRTPKPELNEPFTDEDSVVYGGRPFWEWARDSARDMVRNRRRKMLQVVLYCLASGWLGYWFGAQ